MTIKSDKNHRHLAIAVYTLDLQRKKGGHMLGPIDYIVVGFEGNSFDGSIMEELSKAVKNGTIRVLDLLFIMKDKDGAVTEGEFVDQTSDLKSMLGQAMPTEETPLLSDEDIEKVGNRMDKNTSAGILVIEQLWAKGLKKALLDADGFLIDEGRIHPEVIEAAMKELTKTK